MRNAIQSTTCVETETLKHQATVEEGDCNGSCVGRVSEKRKGQAACERGEKFTNVGGTQGQ